jgi:hypothetical protein
MDRVGRSFRYAAFLTVLTLVSTASVAVAQAEAEVTTGSADNVPLQNKQNEPIVAINPNNPTQVSAGANDNIDLEGCLDETDNTCPFTPGVGVTGFQGSTNGGVSWTQPNYTGWSGRACVGVPGPSDNCAPTDGGLIGTVPWYREARLKSDGDPVQTWGPKPGANGFSWANGERLYYQDLTSHFQAPRDELHFRGFEAIAVSWTDNLPLALAGGAAGKAAWSQPVIISGAQSATTFSDKNWIAADDTSASPFFGNVYACWVSFRSVGGAPEPVMFARSTDGGVTWRDRKQLTQASNTGLGSGRQGCQVDTDSDGVVYVFYRGGATPKQTPPFFTRAILMIRSFDAGVSWERPRVVANVEECGLFDPAQGRLTFDGIAGARTNSFPSVSIANGAPNTKGPNVIFLTWCHGPTPTTAGNGEQARVQWSTNKGATWSAPVDGAVPAHRPDFPALAVSPDGTDVYLTYMNFLQPWQDNTSVARNFRGVVRHASVNPATGMVSAFTTQHEGALGDARGSTANGLVAEFLGDYNAVSATDDFAVAVWNDARNAADCLAMDEFRQAFVNFQRGTGPEPAPPPVTACAPTFGNTDIFSTRINDPT